MRCNVGERMNALVRSDRDRRYARERGQPFEIVMPERLLQEHEPGRSRAVEIAAGGSGRKAAIGGGAERGIWPEGGAHREAGGGIAVGRFSPALDLEETKTLPEPFPHPGG